MELWRPCGQSGRDGGDHVVCGQTYFGDAHDLLVLTARFDRAFRKYRNHRNAFTALLMDTAHLSQTLYLVATDLGLAGLRHRRGQQRRHRAAVRDRRLP